MAMEDALNSRTGFTVSKHYARRSDSKMTKRSKAHGTAANA
jgi:hypothetical protein